VFELNNVKITYVIVALVIKYERVLIYILKYIYKNIFIYFYFLFSF